jgi:hypothetical protein
MKRRWRWLLSAAAGLPLVWLVLPESSAAVPAGTIKAAELDRSGKASP